jgi:hypothetical protein
MRSWQIASQIGHWEIPTDGEEHRYHTPWILIAVSKTQAFEGNARS